MENEAELSGSDVNSDDEMEDSDDNLEEEEGDKEHFDTNELRNQVRLCTLHIILLCISKGLGRQIINPRALTEVIPETV